MLADLQARESVLMAQLRALDIEFQTAADVRAWPKRLAPRLAGVLACHCLRTLSV